jgi:hypothetical protein
MITDGIAESSPAAPITADAVTATERAVAAGDVATYRAARQAERSGKPLDVAAESSPAQPVEQAASTEVTDPPASEPGTPQPKNAETRIKELLAKERAAIARAEAAERKAADLEARQQPRDVPKAAPSPAPATAPFPPYDTYLAEHPESSYEDYLDARADFRAEQRFTALEAEKAQTHEREARSQSMQARDESFRVRIADAVKADPDFFNSLSDDVKTLKPFDAIRDANGRWTAQPTGMHAIAEELLSSEVAPQLMRHFSDHPEDLTRIAGLMPAQLLKEMGKLEARLSTAKPITPPKTVTDAPPPPTTLGTKPGAPANAADAAVASGDQAAYKAARLRDRTANLR